MTGERQKQTQNDHKDTENNLKDRQNNHKGTEDDCKPCVYVVFTLGVPHRRRKAGGPLPVCTHGLSNNRQTLNNHKSISFN